MKRWAALVTILLAATARADGRPTLHEYVPGLGADEGSILLSSGGAQPEGIVYQGEVLPAPEGGPLGPDEEPMRAGEEAGHPFDPPGRRSQSFRPDRVTALDGTIGYHEVFNPAIAPFKRVTAYDSVVLEGDTPILVTAPSPRQIVDIVGADAQVPDARPRDQFWGSVVLDFSAGATVPFPSVGPEARILTLSTEPRSLVTIARDGADNFYATRHARHESRPVRVVFLTDVPRDYFGAPLPSDVRVDVLASRVAALPPSVQRDAETFAAEHGLTRQSRFDEAMRTLVEHFRSFVESRDPPTNTGNIYLDLARGRRGICRHRVYAFVITAQALGIRARFVSNEAHAWTEVQLPSGAWLRVDLGGAAQGLEARGAEDRPVYNPRSADTLPRPPEYEQAHDQARRMSGLRSPDAPSREAEGSGPASEPSAPSSPTAAPAPQNRAARRALELSVDRRSYEVFRGRELEVTGVARGPGGGVANLRVEISLRARRGSERLLGVTVTRDGGAFHGVFGVPPELAVGEYSLLARTPGNREHAPAEAQ